MARTAKKTARTGGKARTGSAPAQRGGRRAGTATRRTAARDRSQQSGAIEGWVSAVNTLAGSTFGREILADVLEAAAASIRKQRQIASEMAEMGAEMVSDAAVINAEAVQEATRVLAEAVSAWSPRALSGAEESEPARGRGRSGRKASKKGRKAG